MTWSKIDDSLHDSGKVAVLSDAAFRLWSMALCWSCREQNEGTSGFIPQDLLGKISEGRWSRAKLKRLTDELESCGKSLGKVGLWEPFAEGGWQIHDWHKYRPEPRKFSRKEAASIAGKKSAEVRKQRTGTAQPRTERTSNVRETFGDTFAERARERRSEDVRPNEHRTSRTPDPDPDPLAEDYGTRAGTCPCPQELELTEAQAENLTMGIGIPREAIDRWTSVLRARFSEAEPRKPEQWRRSLMTAITRDWQDDTKRAAMLGKEPEKAPPRRDGGRGKEPQFDAFERARRLREAEEAKP